MNMKLWWRLFYICIIGFLVSLTMIFYTGLTAAREAFAIVVAEKLENEEEAPPKDSRGRPTLYATVTRIIDGDTVEVAFPKSRHAWTRIEMFHTFSVRLRGVDTPEIKSADTHVKNHALEAKKLLEILSREGTRVRLEGIEWDKYRGRINAIMYSPHSEFSLQDNLIKRGLGVPYSGEGKRPEWYYDSSTMKVTWRLIQ